MGKRASIITIEAVTPKELDAYRKMLPEDATSKHVTIEIGEAKS